MFCPKCGTQVADTATTCPSCGTALGAPRAAGPAAAEKVKAASTDALGAFKVFWANPVGGLAPAYESLGPSRALAVGITFGVVFALCALFGMYRFVSGMFGAYGGGMGVGGFLKLVVIVIVPFVSVAAACAAIRMVFGGSGSLGTDCFIGGASLLPFAVVALLQALLGPGDYQTIMIVALFAVCITILMLFTGLTRVYKISERSATLAVPLIVVVSAFLSKTIYLAMLRA
jgi:hypothetical protein